MQATPAPLNQQLLMLSFIAYTGGGIQSDDLDAELKGLFEGAIARSPTVQGQWEIVWGPATFVAPKGATAANMMFVVQSTASPDTYAVVIRGTNMSAVIDLIEDIGVANLAPWTFGAPAPLKPRYAGGYAAALAILANMRPAANVPGAGLTLRSFLDGLTAAGPIQLLTTGQSLGGGLAPTLALWLQNTQGADWDRNKVATISTYTYAGPSAGDQDFATWSDSCIGANTFRITNSLDVPPLTWNSVTMATAPALYGDISLQGLAQVMIDAQLKLVEGRGYTQIRADQPALTGALNPDKTDWFSQMLYQHVYGYLNVLGLQAETALVEWIFGPGQDPTAAREGAAP